ncbi:MAG: IS5 family transposase [Spirochaetaceae bacterium]|nr:IS5 family transposase [Spirochaetaceae bacterium]
MRAVYPSDISREQFSVIEYDLKSARKATRPRTYDLYDIFCAVLYVLKEGCTWRGLPHDFPKWNIVYHYYQIWSAAGKNGEASLFDRVLRELVLSRRVICGREAKTTMVIIDSKSVKNTDTAEEKGYDAGKKPSGVKVHAAVDTGGLPHAVWVTAANVSDRDGAVEMLRKCAPNLTKVAKALCDGGYSGENFANAVRLLIGAEVEVVKRSELHKFVVLPRRWVVERTFGWLEKFRRLWKNCERKIHNTLQMTILAFIALLLKRY